MWVAKLKSTTKDSIFGEVAKKFNVKIEAYPISYTIRGNKLVVKAAGFAQESKNRKKFLSYIKKNNLIQKLHVINNFAIGVFEAPLNLISLYRPEIIWIKPVSIYDGYENYEIASWNKKYINEFITCLEIYGCKILKLKKENISGISYIGITPNLSSKQKEAFQLAVVNGYYNFPKKIKLVTLAKIMGISYGTYQEHLKKAESKLIPLISQLTK